MLVSEQKMKNWLEKPIWNVGKYEMEKYVLIHFCLFVSIQLLLIFTHELGHAIVGISFGWEIKEFMVSYTAGYVDFSHIPYFSSGAIPTFLVYISGGIVETIFIIGISTTIYKPANLYIGYALPYGLWEGYRGFLIGMQEWDILQVYTGFKLPIVLIGLAITLIILVYKTFEIEKNPNLGNLD
jgi:hypothetical protein